MFLSEAIDKGLVDSCGLNATIANKLSARFRKENKKHNEEEARKYSKEPEDGPPADSAG